MYSVKIDGQLLHDPRIEELIVGGPELNLEVNKAGSFKFTIAPSHPLYDNIIKLKSVVEVYHESYLIFRGRPLNEELDFNNVKTVLCEGDLAFLNDTIQRPYEYTGSVQGYLEALIATHNTQVEAGKQFVIGNVTVTDPNDYIIRADSGYPNTWQVISEKLIKLLGGFIVLRRTGGINIIDYLKDSEYISGQTISLKENILDVNKTKEGQDIATAIIPIGGTVKDDKGIETRVDIKTVNEGADFIYDQAAVDLYGWIFKMVEFKDITSPSLLKARAQQVLTEAITTDVAVEIKAIDKSMIDINVDDFRVFEYVKVESAPHQLNENYLIKKMKIDLANPQNNTLTIGRSYQTFTEKQQTAQNAIKTISENYVKNEAVQEIKNELSTVQSNITQSAEEIRLEVSEAYTLKSAFTTYQAKVSSQLTQTSEGFDFRFANIETFIGEMDDDTKARFNEIVKYIRFINGDIILGESQNPFSLRIANDRISFIQNGVEVAYISNDDNTQMFYIRDGRIVASLQIGDYKFTPKANGNMSLGWVGE